jgi:hypothetical protein
MTANTQLNHSSNYLFSYEKLSVLVLKRWRHVQELNKSNKNWQKNFNCEMNIIIILMCVFNYDCIHYLFRINCVQLLVLYYIY